MKNLNDLKEEVDTQQKNQILNKENLRKILSAEMN